MRGLSWHHGPSDGEFTIAYQKISVDTLVASSILVVQAHLIKSVVNRPRRHEPATVTHEFVLDGVVSDFGVAAGDTPAKPGDHIAVDETMAYEDVPFADDPPVKAGAKAVLFLRPAAGQRARLAANHHALVYTAPFVSKWSQTQDGRVYTAGDALTRIGQYLRGKTLADALRGDRRTVRSIKGIPSDPRGDILSARGISIMTESQKFRTNPRAVLIENARYDGAVTKGML